MSMRIVPAADHPSSFTHLEKSASAPSAPGLHDTLRAGVGPSPFAATSSTPSSRHPLESRLKAWEATQEGARMEGLRKAYGVGEPIRRGMELKITQDGAWRPLALGGAVPSVHEDILRGRDASIGWEDVFTGEEQHAVVGVHDEMERKLKV